MRSKRRGKIKALLIALIILIFLLLTVIILYNKSISGNVVLNPEIPKNCSNESIISLWQSVFTESSNGIQIYTDTSTTGRCDNVIAYKINSDNILYLIVEDYDDFNSNVYNSIGIIRMNATQETAARIRSLILPDDISSLTNLELHYNATNRSISLSQADSEIRTSFKVEPSTWINDSDNSDIVYTFNYTEILSSNKNRTVFSNTYGNKSVSIISISEREGITCIPKWIPHNLSCNSTEKMDTWFTYSYNCPEAGTPPENTTTGCNYDNNSVFGDLKEFQSRTAGTGFSEGLLIYIDSGLANTTKIVNQTKKVEIKTSNQTYVEFSWDFASPLDIALIEVKRQSSEGIGSIVVNGLAGVNKTVILDSLIDTNEICIRNEEVSSASSISVGCSKPDEIRLSCPQSKGKISCEFDGGYFTIYGLNNSAAKEINLSASEEICTPSWNCTLGECINNTQTNTCTDTNHCNSLLDKPAENQMCGELAVLAANSSCIPSLNCTQWSACGDKNRTRVCIDANNCIIGNQTQSEDCETPQERTRNTIFLMVIFVIIALIAIVTIILIIQFAKHK